MATQENIAVKMESLEERLHKADLSNAHTTLCLQHINTFRAQLQFAFAPADVGGGILDALDLMVELHLDQALRHDGTPYIEHPLTVASQVLEAMAHKDPDGIVAALLHDAVEDQAPRLAHKARKRSTRQVKFAADLALDAIEERTRSSKVRSMISGLTNPDYNTLLAQKGILKKTVDTEQTAFLAAKNAIYAAHVRDAIRDPGVGLIKLFDLASNALALDTIPDATTRKRLLVKYTPVMSIMLARLRETATPLNITRHKREELLARFAEAMQTHYPYHSNHYRMRY